MVWCYVSYKQFDASKTNVVILVVWYLLQAVYLVYLEKKGSVRKFSQKLSGKCVECQKN